VSERDPRDVIRIEELERENAALREELARVRGELKELTRIVEELQKRARKDKRQAHLFGRESEKKDKKKAGRMPGHEGAFRERPGHVDESVEARLDGCPCCGEPVFNVEELLQYVIDLPEIRMHVLQILTERGWCRRCRKHVRSTHPRQVSKAGGAAAVAMGPKASALVVELKTRQGVPYRDIAELFSRYLNFPVTHGALVQATVRLADRATPDYLNLVDEVRASALVHSDETGWRIARRSAWLWVFCTDAVTIYIIDYRRSADVVLDVLGEDFKGRLLSDGLPALDKLAKHGFLRAQCNGHIIRRCRELAAVAAGRASHFPVVFKRRCKTPSRWARCASSCHQHATSRAWPKSGRRCVRSPRATTPTRRTSSWPSTSTSTRTRCSPSSTTRRFRPPTTTPSTKSAAPSSCARLGAVTAKKPTPSLTPSSPRMPRRPTGVASDSTTSSQSGWLLMPPATRSGPAAHTRGSSAEPRRRRRVPCVRRYPRTTAVTSSLLGPPLSNANRLRHRPIIDRVFICGTRNIPAEARLKLIEGEFIENAAPDCEHGRTELEVGNRCTDRCLMAARS
jgi:hypothetical protein